VVRTRSTITGRPFATVAAATVDDVDNAVNAAADATAEWVATSPGQRRTILDKAAQLLSDRRADITALMSSEMGAVMAWCEFNVRVAVGMLREAAVQTYSMVARLFRPTCQV
jgi:vanillin dehydrogenase